MTKDEFRKRLEEYFSWASDDQYRRPEDWFFSLEEFAAMKYGEERRLRLEAEEKGQ